MIVWIAVSAVAGVTTLNFQDSVMVDPTWTLIGGCSDGWVPIGAWSSIRSLDESAHMPLVVQNELTSSSNRKWVAPPSVDLTDDDLFVESVT
jgi:hypothetical protein